MTLVNLLPWREKVLKRRGRDWIIRSLLMLAGVSACCSVLRISLIQQQRGAALRLTWQQQEYVLAGELLKTQRQLSQQVAAIQQQKAGRQTQIRQLRNWGTFWARLPELMPDRLWLLSVRLSRQTLTFSGLCDTLPQLVLFAQNLRLLPYLGEVRIQEFVRSEAGGYRFMLTAALTAELWPEQGGNNA